MSRFGYAASGLLNSEVVEPGGTRALTLTTRYTHDAHGNVTAGPQRGVQMQLRGIAVDATVVHASKYDKDGGRRRNGGRLRNAGPGPSAAGIDFDAGDGLFQAVGLRAAFGYQPAHFSLSFAGSVEAREKRAAKPEPDTVCAQDPGMCTGQSTRRSRMTAHFMQFAAPFAQQTGTRLRALAL